MAKQPRNRNEKFQRKSNTKGKEVEVNVRDSSLNEADFQKRKTGKKANENDPSWYSHYKTLLKDVTGVNFGNVLGSSLLRFKRTTWKDNSGADVSANVTTINNNVAGICTIHFIPTLGSATDKMYDSVANKVAVQLYSAMRMKLGSTASYEPCDVMMYLGAMDSAYMLYALGVKIYGCMRLASPFNLYFMRPLLQSMEVDWTSFETSLNDFRAYINRFAIYLSSLEVPSEFDIFKRHIWMMTNLFTDSNSAKAQLYHYMLDGYYVYTEATEGPSYLKYTSLDATSQTLLTYADYVAACDQVMNALLGSSDITQMSADIGKAFEHDVFALSAIPDDYLTPISYSQEVLSQIENCKLNGSPRMNKLSDISISDNYNTWDIYQDNSLSQTNPKIKQYPVFMSSTATTAQAKANRLTLLEADALLNMHHASITPEEVMVATRGITCYYNYQMGADATILKYWPTYFGTEIYTKAVFCVLSASSSGAVVKREFEYANVGTTSNPLESLVSLWSQFDWAPTIWISKDNSTWEQLQDTDMYAVVNATQIKDMNTCAVLSEFYSTKFPQLHE